MITPPEHSSSRSGSGFGSRTTMPDLTPETLAELRQDVSRVIFAASPGAFGPHRIARILAALPALLDAAENQDILIGSANHYKDERDALAAKLDAVREVAEHYAGLTNVDVGSAILRALDGSDPARPGESHRCDLEDGMPHRWVTGIPPESWSLSWKMSVRELSGRHLGKRIRVDGWSGILTAVVHDHLGTDVSIEQDDGILCGCRRDRDHLCEVWL